MVNGRCSRNSSNSVRRTVWILAVLISTTTTVTSGFAPFPQTTRTRTFGVVQQQPQQQYRLLQQQQQQQDCSTTRMSSGSATTRLSLAAATAKYATATFLDALSAAASDALGRSVQLESASGGGMSGGGGATTSAVVDAHSNTKYFVKSASGSETAIHMLYAEYVGVKEMADTNTIRVPRPIAYGTHEPPGGGGALKGGRAFVIFEWLDFARGGGGGSQFELGQKLAQLHKCTSPNHQFGFHVDNTCGATPQPNLPWMDSWPDFWDERRLNHMLKLLNNLGYDDQTIQKLRTKTKVLLSQHNPPPSLIHGDLWGGNKGFIQEDGDGRVVPCIFDPATYYGDREAELAMTYVFGGFNSDFYKGYESEWPLPDGHEQRRIIYELYHILNHAVLFGGSYRSQAKGMMEQILRL